MTNRQPKGIPVGGQFATGAKSENGDLTVPGPRGALDWAPDRRLGEKVDLREAEANWDKNRPQPWYRSRMSLAYTAPGAVAYAIVGHVPSNTWFGSSRAYANIMRRIVLTEDDTIFCEPAIPGYPPKAAERCLVTADGQRYGVCFAPNTTHPFEKGPASPDPAPETGILISGARMGDSTRSKDYTLPEDTHRGWRSFGSMGYIEPEGFIPPAEGSPS